ncbi:MAG: PKD domain-containing protein [Thermoplasmata archaeon]|nr:PKD domain-containing protein [Thermoplasmata archaeon]
MVLFGGDSAFNGGWLNDTWLFRGGSWIELCSGNSTEPTCAASPPALTGAAMVYDPESAGLVLFGGLYNGDLNEWKTPRLSNLTWIFRDGNWSNVSSSVAPPGGGEPDGDNALQMAYDPPDRCVVLFLDGETWAFSNSTWTNVHPPTSPTIRNGSAFFYDPTAGGLIMSGGGLPSGSGTNQTWLYRGNSWMELYPKVSLPEGAPFGSAYDLAFGYGISFGQEWENNSTWTFANGTWVDSAAEFGPHSPPTVGAGVWTPSGLAYDSTDDYTMLLDSTDVGPHWEASFEETWVLLDPFTVHIAASASVRDVGQNLTYQVSARGGLRPYQINISSVPPGCEVPFNITNSTSFTCRPNVSGFHQVSVNVTEASGTFLHAVLPLTLYPDLTATATVSRDDTTLGIPESFHGYPVGGAPALVNRWTVSDGSSGNGTVLNRTFSSAGTYVATFTATDGTGAMARVNETVVVAAELVVVSQLSANVTDVGIPVAFNATGAGGTAPLVYHWEFGNGNASSSNFTKYAYSSAGTYAPSLWVNDSGGAEFSTEFTLRVNPALRLTASANASSVDLGSPTEFAATPVGGTAPYTYSWGFGSGFTNDSRVTNHTFVTLGNHSAALVVNDSAGGTQSVQITVDVVVAHSSTGAPPNSGTNGGGGPGVPLWESILVIGAVAGSIALGAVALVLRRPPGQSGRKNPG